MNRLLLAIDGNSLLYQAYHAFFKANLTTRDGFPTGALKGFFTKLIELLKLEPSHVLTGIGLPAEVAHGSLRLSLGRFTTEEDVDYILACLPKVVGTLRSMSPVWKG